MNRSSVRQSCVCIFEKVFLRNLKTMFERPPIPKRSSNLKLRPLQVLRARSYKKLPVAVSGRQTGVTKLFSRGMIAKDYVTRRNISYLVVKHLFSLAGVSLLPTRSPAPRSHRPEAAFPAKLTPRHADTPRTALNNAIDPEISLTRPTCDNPDARGTERR